MATQECKHYSILRFGNRVKLALMKRALVGTITCDPFPMEYRICERCDELVLDKVQAHTTRGCDQSRRHAGDMETAA